MSSFQCSFITATIVFFEVQVEEMKISVNSRVGLFLLLQKVMVVPSLNKTVTETISSSAIIRIHEKQLGD